MERVLLVEDDRELGLQIVGHLRRAGYEVAWWQRGQPIEPSDLPGLSLVVLDLMLPGMAGIDILRDFRTRSEIPVLVLSARDETGQKVKALQLGADDYLTKPFWPEELIERVRARLRRPALVRDGAVEVGPLRLDPETREVRLYGEALDLTAVEFAFLLALARRPGVAITRRWLAEHVLSPEREGGERTLDVHASRLRKKLKDKLPIETVWGIGYRLARLDE